MSDEPNPIETAVWTDAHELLVEGQGWASESQPYTRLPDRAEGNVPEDVWNLSRQTAGVSVRFYSDAEEIFVRWELAELPGRPEHMTLCGRGGLDLYARRDDGRWAWAGAAQPWLEGTAYDARLNFRPFPRKRREYRLYLPLRTQLTSLQIGVQPGDELVAAEADERLPVVVYGTSIVHGVSATRPGMAWALQMARRHDRPQITLGFAGRARMQPGMPEMIAELNAAIFVVDCLPNMGPVLIRERMPILASTLREAHPETPILFIGDRRFGDASFAPARAANKAGNDDAQREIFEQLRAEGMENIHLLQHPHFFGPDDEGTIDASHPTDLGSWHMANVVAPVVQELLVDHGFVGGR